MIQHGSNLVQLDREHDIAFGMGEIIADLHMAFLRCEDAVAFWNNSLLNEMKGWVWEKAAFICEGKAGSPLCDGVYRTVIYGLVSGGKLC